MAFVIDDFLIATAISAAVSGKANAI